MFVFCSIECSKQKCFQIYDTISRVKQLPRLVIEKVLEEAEATKDAIDDKLLKCMQMLEKGRYTSVRLPIFKRCDTIEYFDKEQKSKRSANKV